MPGVQTLVPVMLTHVAEGRLTLERLRRPDQPRPAARVRPGRQGATGRGLRRRPHHRRPQRPAHHPPRRTWPPASGWTPFDGFEAKGWPMATIIRGRVGHARRRGGRPARRRAGAVPRNPAVVLMRLRIATWNINSVRLRAPQVARFVAEQAPDVLCLQEIKCREGEFPTHGLRRRRACRTCASRPEGLARRRHRLAPADRGRAGAGRLPRGPRPLRRRRGGRRRDPATSTSRPAATCPTATLNPKFDHKLDFYERLTAEMAARDPKRAAGASPAT